MVYNQTKAHNMLLIMLNLHFKNVKSYKIMWAILLQIVANYGTKIACPLLLQAYHHLNPNKTPTKPLVVKDNDLISQQIVSLDNVILSTLKNELQIFQRLSMTST